tara:strand:- start:1301 stop:2236 length:936 start_codon:yes stop_codon:yes gene_type:complete
LGLEDQPGEFSDRIEHLSSADIGNMSRLTDDQFISLFGLTTMTILDESSGTDEHFPVRDGHSDASLVFAGCSETEGELITNAGFLENQQYVWGALLAKSMDKSYLNIGVGSSSVYSIAHKIMRYCENNKKPSHVVALLPPLGTRLPLAIDPNKLVAYKNGTSDSFIQNVVSSWADPPKMSKAPHAAEEIFSPIMMTYFSANSLRVLESYCRDSNINLAYSTWHGPTETLIEAANASARVLGYPSPFKSFVNSKAETWTEARNTGKNIYSDCHEDLREKNPKCFHMGMNDHMGTHRHQHIADKFLRHFSRFL